jgi:glycosyltransferase involved in cell wall biosynthesis
MRIAHWSPLPPERSGIADYAAELLPELAQHCEIELIVEPGTRLPSELARFRSHPPERLPQLLNGSGPERCDTVVYHLGNNRDYHTGIYRSLLVTPGVVVLHDALLHHLIRDLTLYSGDAEGYLEEMRYAYGATGLAQARRSVVSGVPLDPWSYPLVERVVDRSLAMIAHNRYTAERVRASRPDTRLAVVHHHLSLGALAGRDLPAAEARAQLGLAPQGVVVASFGFFTAAKRLEVLLRAFARLRRELPDAQLLLAGEVSPHYDFETAFLEELRAGVTITGRLDLPAFLAAMAAADIAVNLRFPTAGETSGTLIRLLGLGKPVIVSRAGAFAEIPDDCCAKVDVDDSEEALLYAYLHRLAVDPGLRRVMGENARRHIREQHSLAGSARAYADFIAQTVATGAAAFRAAPPLAPYAPADLLTELVSGVSAELVGLGLVGASGAEGDADVLLREIAASLVELDLDLPGERR